jgi:tetratricopeptide (TPR) repeat protein
MPWSRTSTVRFHLKVPPAGVDDYDALTRDDGEESAMKPHRKNKGATGWAICMIALLPSCALFTSRPSRELDIQSELPATTAAWLIAELCRQEMPAGEDLAMHAFPPMHATDDRTFVIWYIGDAGDGFRVVRNGRISPPDRGSAPLVGCRFLPNATPSGNTATAEDEVWIEVRDDGAGGSTIRLRLEGTPAVRGLTDRVVRALRTGHAVRQTAEFIAQGEYAAAESCAAAELATRDQDASAHHELLVARLHHFRARVDLAGQDFAAARAHLRQALRADASLRVARTLLAETCRRMADRRGFLTHDRGRATGLDELSANALERGAAELLAAGDITAAQHWAKKVLHRTPRSLAAMRVLAETLVAQRKPQRALETELLALERFGFDAALVLGVAQRYATLGNGMAGARLLARFHNELDLAQPRRADKLMRRLCKNLEPGPAYRLLRGHDMALAQTFRHGAGPACTELFSQLATMRRSHDEVAATAPQLATRHTMDGYRSAPGVRPAR